MDSFDPDGSSNPENLLNNWVKFYWNIAPENSHVQWQQCKLQKQKQTDGYSCGIFAINFIERLLRGDFDLKSYLTNDDLTQKRIFIW